MRSRLLVAPRVIAYARSGDFAKAGEWQQKAAADPKQERDDSVLQRLRIPDVPF